MKNFPKVQQQNGNTSGPSVWQKSTLVHLVLLRSFAVLTLRDAREHPFLRLGGVQAHHLVEPRLLAADHGAESLLLHLLGEFRVVPAGVAVVDVDARVLLVPRREVRVHVAFDRPQAVLDEIYDAGYPLSTICNL
jgi:hypothetical protein